MAQDIPDWLSPNTPPQDEAAIDRRHLNILRQLLARDYLTRADWHYALSDLASMAREALGAASTLVALIDPISGDWTAITNTGQTLEEEDISQVGSLSVLEEIRMFQSPLLTTSAQPLEVNSMSIARQQVESVLAVPLYWWDVTDEQPERRLGGCLYAHRTAQQPRFEEHDVTLFLDIANLVQPTLNMLRRMRDLEAHLEGQRTIMSEMLADYRLGDFETQDSWFAQAVITPLRRIAHADKVGLLILGPTGAGKSYLARAFHNECQRKNGPFITLDCSQVTSVNTLSAELFGYARDSGYNNAPPRGRAGKAALADGGTLFIDEIGALPAELQAKLLRLIQEGRFSPLGSAEEHQVDIQIVAATNEDLLALVEEGRFREDLYWRIQEIVIELPNLNARVADIPSLAHAFLAKAAGRFKKPETLELTLEAQHALVHYDWANHGNIRGLEHIINRTVVLMAPGKHRIERSDLQLGSPKRYGARQTTAVTGRPHIHNINGRFPRQTTPAHGMPVSLSPENIKRILLQGLEAHGFNVRAMARDGNIARGLGLSTAHIPTSKLYNWFDELKIDLAIERERFAQEQLRKIVGAIRDHGSGSAAARTLGMSRDTLVWHLRKAGTSVKKVLREAC